LKKVLTPLVVVVLFVCLTFSILAVQVKADPAEPPEWARTYGGAKDDMYHDTVVIKTNDGGYALAGYTENFGAVQKDFWLVKTDADGNPEWNKTYDRQGGVERPLSVIQTSDGGYAITGVARTSEIAVNSNDFWLVKTDADGNPEWNKTYDGGARDDGACTVIETNDGGYALVGSTNSFGGDFDAWLIKTYSDGTMEWNYSYGGSGHDYGYSMVYTSDGEYIIAGQTPGQTGPSSPSDFWLFKVNSTGQLQWERTYGGPYGDSALSVIQTSDGGYAMTGYAYPLGAGNMDFWLVKTNSTGHEQWNQTYGGPNDEHACSVIQTVDGGYAIVGCTESFGAVNGDFWLVKTNSTGHEQWNWRYGGDGEDWGQSVIQTSDGGYVLAGYTNSCGAGGWDGWLIKLAPEKRYLVVQTEPLGLMDILGEGWYDKGTNVELRAPTFVPSEGGENGVRYRFDYWTIDGNIILGNPITVQMDANHTATAHYVRQCCLTIISPHGTTVGEGWYDEDETAYATVTPLIVSGPEGVRYVFTHWSGDAAGTMSPSDPITMNAPKTAIANWKTQYYLTVISPYDIPGGEGWYDEGEIAYATVAVGLDYVDTTAYGFVGWSGDASGWDLISEPIVMNAPKTAVANWEASTSYGDVRTIGFWKHQVNVWYFTELKNNGMKIRGIGTAQISEEALITYLTFIDSNSDYFRGKIVGATNLDTLRNAYNMLKTPTGSDSMKMRAEQQLFAVWLNLAHNAFFWNTQLSQDTLYIYWQYTYDEKNGLATIGEAILFSEAELIKPNGNYEAAKNICDSINNNLGIIWGT